MKFTRLKKISIWIKKHFFTGGVRITMQDISDSEINISIDGKEPLRNDQKQ